MNRRAFVLIASTACLFALAGCTLLQRAPMAAFDVRPVVIYANEEITLDASPSTGNGSIVDYAWSLGDGRTASGREVTATFPSAGVYIVNLTVEDSRGQVDTVSQEIPVYVRSGTTIFEEGFENGLLALSAWELDSTWASESESTVERVNNTSGYALLIRSTREHWHRRYVPVLLPPLRTGQAFSFSCRVMTLANQEDAMFMVIPFRREVASTAGSLPYYLFTSQGDGSYLREPTAYGTDVGHPVAFQPDVYRWHDLEIVYGADSYEFSVDGTLWYSGPLSCDISQGGEWFIMVGEESSTERCNAYFDEIRIRVSE